MNERQCSSCGKVKLVSEFYFNRKRGVYETKCKACKLAYQKERHKQVMNDPILHHKRLLTQSKYRDRYRDRIAEKERLKRRKMGISKQQYVDKDLLLQMYADGFPIDVIAKHCHCVPATVKLYAYRNGIRRGKGKHKNCYYCIKNPCFVGIDNFTTNFAQKCKDFLINNKKNRKIYERQRKQNK